MGRHGRNTLDNYIAVHESYMQSFFAQGFVQQDSCDFLVLSGLVTLTGRVHCLGGIELCVLKQIDVLQGQGAMPVVQRSTYNYHAQFLNGPYIFRYDSPVDHRPFHHKHVFDPLSSRKELRIDRIDDIGQTPTMGDVLTELQRWYWENASQIDQLGFV